MPSLMVNGEIKCHIGFSKSTNAKNRGWLVTLSVLIKPPIFLQNELQNYFFSCGAVEGRTVECTLLETSSRRHLVH